VLVRLLDISEVGMRLLLPTAAAPPGVLGVTVRDADGNVCIRRMAGVRWWSLGREGTVVAGLEFGRPIESEVVSFLGKEGELAAEATCRAAS
jgi:hypothetical protein